MDCEVAVRPKARQCLICGDVICGCPIHTAKDSMQSVYGICDACTDGIAGRLGEKRVVSGEVPVLAARTSDTFALFRVQRKLTAFRRERGLQRATGIP